MSKYPEVIHSYEEFNDANPFEPIKLVGTVCDPSNITQDICRELMAVVHYHTPFTCTDSTPCVIAFTLSESVNVNTIIGWPTISQLGMNLLVMENIIHSTIIQQKFSITNTEPHLGLPASTTFDPNTFQQSTFHHPPSAPMSASTLQHFVTTSDYILPSQ